MIRVYTVEEYIAGLKAQNIVVYPLLEERIRELNRQGIVQGCFPMTGDLIPIKDMRYSAGYYDQFNAETQQSYQHFNTSNNQVVNQYETYNSSIEKNGISIKLTLKEAVTIVEEALKRDDKVLAVKVMLGISSSIPMDVKVNG